MKLMNGILLLHIAQLITLAGCYAPAYRNQVDLKQIHLADAIWAKVEVETYRYDIAPPDSGYGRSETAHIKVAYRTQTDTLQGPRMEHFYLAHLACTCGSKVAYYRGGSCCPVKSEHAQFGDHAMLDIYALRCKQCKNKSTIYLNMYDHDTAVYAPVGFQFRK